MNLDPTDFLVKWNKNIEALGIDTSGFSLDHVAFDTATVKEYENYKNEFSIISDLVREVVISDRRIAVFKLYKPWTFGRHTIWALELIEPEIGQKTITGFNHAEFSINNALQELVNKYPSVPWNTKSINCPEFPRLKISFPDGTEVKFNTDPILEQ